MKTFGRRPTARLRGAVVGAGLIAGKKHIPAFLKQKDKIELVALCDVNFEAARNIGSSFGIRHVYSGLSEMLFKEKVDVVDICTPPHTHAKLAVEAMRHGCHVLIEKPMALTVSDCDEIVNASRETGVKVCVAHSDLFYWPFMRARELVARGDIGDFRGMRIFLSTPTDYMTSHKEHWAHRLPGGVIGETGPHVVYMSLAFINPIRRASVDAMKLLDYPWSQFEDYRIDLIGDNGISSITLSYATDQWMARVDILGSKGTLLLDLEGMWIVRSRRPELKPMPIGLSVLSESAQIVWSLLSNGMRFATRSMRSTHEILLERFVESVVRGTEPPVTAEEGREAVRVTNMIVDKLKERCG
jgi:predicted dehydrogenase